MYDIAALPPLKRHWIAKTSNIPRRYHGFDYDSIREDLGSVPEVLTKWLEDVLAGDVILNSGGLGTTGVGLLFDGSPGRGKTTHAVTTLVEFVRGLPDDSEAAAKLLHCRLEDYSISMRPIYYLTMTDLLYKKKLSFDADSAERKALHLEMEGFHGRADDDRFNVRLLLLDDAGKEYGSKYDDFSFDDILRARYDKGLPTIITTNRERESWGAQYSDSMGSFVHEAFRRVKLGGEDLRKRS